MGMTFVHRLKKSTGADYAAIARAWIFCREAFSLESVWQQVGELGSEVNSSGQLELLDTIRRLIRRAARRFIHNRVDPKALEADIESVKAVVAELLGEFPSFLPAPAQSKWQGHYAELLNSQMPDNLARLGASANYMFAVLSVHEVAKNTGAKPAVVGGVYFTIGATLKLDALHEILTGFDVKNHWQAMAREVHLDEIDFRRRQLAALVVNNSDEITDYAQAVDQWVKTCEDAVAKWLDLCSEVESYSEHDFSLFAVSSRALSQLSAS